MQDNPSISTFSETAALYAVLNEDYEEARRIVTSFLPGECGQFAKQLDTLRSMLTDQFGNDLPF